MTELPPLPTLKRIISTLDISELEDKRQKLDCIQSLFLASDELPKIATIGIPALIRTPSASHQEIVSDNGKRKWILLKQIGKGGCGEVFLAKEMTDGLKKFKSAAQNDLVALKLVKDKKQFQTELRTMRILNKSFKTKCGTPKLFCACRKSKAIVMEYVADSLSHQFERCNSKFSLKTCLMLAINMLRLSRDFHARTGQVHVDIKPSNFCTGVDGKSLVLIDFGYSVSPEVKLPGQTGTPLFMAWTIQTLGNTYPTWRDDLESIGYVLMFFLAGGKKGLPWGNLRTHKDIAKSKNDECIRNFCNSLKFTEYQPIADCLQTLLFLTRNRTGQVNPNIDYCFLLGIFEKVLVDMNMSNDGLYDWVSK